MKNKNPKKTVPVPVPVKNGAVVRPTVVYIRITHDIPGKNPELENKYLLSR